MNLRDKSLAGAVLLLAGLLTGSPAKAEVQENDTVPLDQLVFIDCDSNGEPEDVLELQGDLHVVTTETIDKAGGVHITTHFQPVNVSAVGEITGDTYNAVGLTRESVTFNGDNLTDTFVNNFYMIGRKSGIKYLIHETFHLTVVNGDVVVSVDHADVRCP